MRRHQRGRPRPESSLAPAVHSSVATGSRDGYTMSSPAGEKALDKGGRVKIYPGNKTARHAPFMQRLPVVVKQYDGRSIASDPFTDRDFINKPSVMLYPWKDINIAAQMGANSDTVGSTYSNYVQNVLFNDIVRALQSQRLINLSNISLQNPVAAPAFPTAFTVTSYQAWWNYYLKAALIIRALESCYVAGDINFTLSQIAAVVQANKTQLDAVAAQLKAFKVPQAIITWVDRLSGVKLTNDNEPAIIYGTEQSAVGADTVDLTLSVSISSMINDAQLFVTRLVNPGFSSGPGANYSTDFQTITSTHALAYGNQADWPVKGVSHDASEYWQGYGAAAVYKDTVAVLNFSWPNSAVLDMIPILVPEGMTEEDGMFMASMLGMVRYCSDPDGTTTATTPNLCGVYTQTGAQNAASDPMGGAIYSQVGSIAHFVETGAAAATTVFTNIELEHNFWLPYARAEVTTAAGGYNADRRALRDLAIVKSRRSDLWEASIIAIQQWFLGSLL